MVLRESLSTENPPGNHSNDFFTTVEDGKASHVAISQKATPYGFDLLEWLDPASAMG